MTGWEVRAEVITPGGKKITSIKHFSEIVVDHTYHDAPGISEYLLRECAREIKDSMRERGE